MPQGQKASSFEDRVNWLVEHPELWKKWFVNTDIVTFFLPGKGHDRVALGRRNLFLNMQKDRLFSNRTYWLDAKLYHELIAANKILRERNICLTTTLKN